MKLRQILATGICLCSFSVATVLGAQQDTATLSGTISDNSGRMIANAKVSVKNDSTGSSAETQSDPSGKYRVGNLASGDYVVSVQNAGFDTKTSKVTLTSSGAQTLDFVLIASSAPASLSLQDLGFSAAETQANPQLQALLQKRTAMLKMHQRLGLHYSNTDDRGSNHWPHG